MLSNLMFENLRLLLTWKLWSPLCTKNSSKSRFPCHVDVWDILVVFQTFYCRVLTLFKLEMILSSVISHV